MGQQRNLWQAMEKLENLEGQTIKDLNKAKKTEDEVVENIRKVVSKVEEAEQGLARSLEELKEVEDKELGEIRSPNDIENPKIFISKAEAVLQECEQARENISKLEKGFQAFNEASGIDFGNLGYIERANEDLSELESELEKAIEYMKGVS